MVPSKIDKIKLTREQDRRAKTSKEDVKKMRDLYEKGISQKNIAKEFNVSQSCVSYIVSDIASKNLKEYRKNNPPKNRTKEEARQYARELRAYKKCLLNK